MVLSAPPNLNELWRQEQVWNERNSVHAQVRRSFDERLNALAQEINLLEAHERDWLATLQQSQETDDLKEVFDRIRSSLAAIQSSLATVRDRQRLLVANENLISEEGRLSASIVQRIKQTRHKYEGSLFTRDNYPLWNPRAYLGSDQRLMFNYGGNFLRDLVSSGQLIRIQTSWIAISGLLTTMTLILILRLKRKLKDRDQNRRP